jgi:hypothetical protein
VDKDRFQITFPPSLTDLDVCRRATGDRFPRTAFIKELPEKDLMANLAALLEKSGHILVRFQEREE